MRGTWQTTDGGGAVVPVVLIAVGVAVAVGSGAAASAARVAGEVLQALLITVAVVVGVAVAAGAGLVVWRVRHGRPVLPRVVVQGAPPPQVAARQQEALRQERQALPEGGNHLHVHVPESWTPQDAREFMGRQGRG